MNNTEREKELKRKRFKKFRDTLENPLKIKDKNHGNILKHNITIEELQEYTNKLYNARFATRTMRNIGGGLALANILAGNISGAITVGSMALISHVAHRFTQLESDKAQKIIDKYSASQKRKAANIRSELTIQHNLKQRSIKSMNDTEKANFKKAFEIIQTADLHTLRKMRDTLQTDYNENEIIKLKRK